MNCVLTKLKDWSRINLLTRESENYLLKEEKGFEIKMKKVLSISLTLLLVLSGLTAAFAADANKTVAAAAATTSTTGSGIETTGAAVTTASGIETTGAAVTTSSAVETTGTAITIVPDMTFTGTPVKLSLDAAYKKMLSDSPGAKMADLNQKKAYGVSQGYAESVHLISKSEQMGGDYSSSDKAVLKVYKTYAAAQGPRNYDASMNKLKKETLDNYYSLKELENQLQIAKDNLALKEKLLSNTQLKYKLGTVAKSDVLQAETSLYEAKDKLLAAQNGFDQMKMEFNQFMGYDLMQNVTLTDTIKEIPLSTKSLTDSIKTALTNRNEIYEAAFNLEASTLNLKSYGSYPLGSSKYINAKISMLTAETNYKDAPLTVESDVRTKYMAMNAKYSIVQTGKKSVENAKETERLKRLQYDSGMATLSDVEGVQLDYYNTQLDYSKALLEYNLAVNDYELTSTVGTTAASIQ